MLFNPIRFYGVRIPGLASILYPLPAPPGPGHPGHLQGRALRLAGHRALARSTRWPASRSTRRWPRSAASRTSTSSSSPTRSPTTWSPLRRPRSARWSTHHGTRAPPAMARPPAVDARGRARAGRTAAALDRPRHHDRDRRPHRPADRRQVDGDPLFRRAPRDDEPDAPRGRARKSSGSCATSASTSDVPLGIAMVFIVQAFPHWWVLPLGGIVIGYLVNYIGITMIFEPVFPKQIGRIHTARAVPASASPR